MWVPLHVLALSGCTASSVQDSAAPASDALAPPDLTLEWTADELVGSLDRLFEYGLPESVSLSEIYLELMAHGDGYVGGCPTDPLVLTDDVVEGCTAASGWFYAGISTWEELSEEEEGVGWGFTGDFRIISPDQEVYTVAGNVHALAPREDPENEWSVAMHGSWHSTWHGGWLERGLSASVEYFRREDQMTLVGVMQADDVAVEFVDVILEQDLDTCGGIREAQVAIRDPSGLWVDWQTSCSPCGPVSLDDEVLAESVCLDVTGLFDGLVERVQL